MKRLYLQGSTATAPCSVRAARPGVPRGGAWLQWWSHCSSHTGASGHTATHVVTATLVVTQQHMWSHTGASGHTATHLTSGHTLSVVVSPVVTQLVTVTLSLVSVSPVSSSISI